MSTDVSYQCLDGAAWLTLSRGEAGNPIDLEMVSALQGAVRRAQVDDARVVVLRAEGKAFSVGGNIAAFADAPDPGAFIQELADNLHAMILELQDLNAVVVSSVHATAAGAGFPLAAAADIVLAADTARFTFAYTKIGLTPDGGSSLLTATVGLHRALQLALLNPMVSAAEAHAMGIVAQVHPAEDLAAATSQVVASLLAGSRSAQVGAKRLLRGKAAPDAAADLDRETASISAAAASHDGREGVAAFLAKRAPSYLTGSS